MLLDTSLESAEALDQELTDCLVAEEVEYQAPAPWRPGEGSR